MWNYCPGVQHGRPASDPPYSDEEEESVGLTQYQLPEGDVRLISSPQYEANVPEKVKQLARLAAEFRNFMYNYKKEDMAVFLQECTEKFQALTQDDIRSTIMGAMRLLLLQHHFSAQDLPTNHANIFCSVEKLRSLVSACPELIDLFKIYKSNAILVYSLAGEWQGVVAIHNIDFSQVTDEENLPKFNIVPNSDQLTWVVTHPFMFKLIGCMLNDDVDLLQKLIVNHEGCYGDDHLLNGYDQLLTSFTMHVPEYRRNEDDPAVISSSQFLKKCYPESKFFISHLEWAARFGALKCFKYFLLNGKGLRTFDGLFFEADRWDDISEKYCRWDNILDCAVLGGNTEIIRIALQEKNIADNIADKKLEKTLPQKLYPLNNVFWSCVRTGRSDILRYFLTEHPIQWQNGEPVFDVHSAYYFALQQGDTDLAAVLSDFLPDVENHPKKLSLNISKVLVTATPLGDMLLENLTGENSGELLRRVPATTREEVSIWTSCLEQ